jgi:hypothetical protein
MTWRRCLRIGAFVLALASAAGAGAPSTVAIPSGLQALFDSRDDVILRRAAVPSEANRVGEVRALRRGEAVVVQTLLNTRILRRAVGEIKKKERANWQANRDGSGDASRYVSELEAARDALTPPVAPGKPRPSERLRLLIEFVRSPSRVALGIGTFDASRTEEATPVRSGRFFTVWEPSRSYVETNMRLIVADSMQLDAGAAEELLGF